MRDAPTHGKLFWPVRRKNLTAEEKKAKKLKKIGPKQF
jgi:hypothetical protein